VTSRFLTWLPLAAALLVLDPPARAAAAQTKLDTAWLARPAVSQTNLKVASPTRPAAPPKRSETTPLAYPAATLRVGRLNLTHCEPLATAPPRRYCGQLQRPLDPANPRGEQISIHFEYYRHTAPGRSFGVMVAAEGGPGYPSTLSRDDYYPLYEPLKDRNDLVLMDSRGTGRSGAIRCHALQMAAAPTVELIGECGRQLGSSAVSYSTTLAADDLAAILEALQLPAADLYGDSYGTYFAQVFAVRHGDKLRSIVLDGAYPLSGPDYAWYPNYAPAMRAKFNVACARSPHCARLAGDSISHIRPALELLRQHPHAASAADADGVMRSFQADAAHLATVMFSAAPPYATLRETDAAARAFRAGDEAPLLRLMAESAAAVDSRDTTNDATRWSAGLAAAVMCVDPPQIFDLNLPPEQRRAQFQQRIAERARALPLAYEPFTLDEYRGLPLDYSFIEQCLDWPAPPPSYPAPRVSAAASYPDVPALVISGEFDDLTSVADGSAAAAAFKRGRHVILANSFHVNALPRGRTDCAQQIVQRFLKTLEPGDTRCAQAVPEIPLARDFARSVQEVEPATAHIAVASDLTLRCAAAAVLTAGDVLTRVRANGSGHGVGLRGGSFHIEGPAENARVELSEVRWIQDLPVSGEILWRGARAPVSAHLRWQAPSACGNGELQADWPQDAPRALATLRGQIDGAAVEAELPAP